MLINFFKMFISFSLVAGMMLIYKVPLSPKMLYFFPILAVLLAFTFGISTMVLHFGVFVEDLKNIISVLFKLIFYLSGIFYSLEKRVPAPYGTLMLRANPIAYLINEFRRVLLYNQWPDQCALLFWLASSLFLSYLGIRIIYKNENSYIKVI